jgi:hypothetical protein
VRVKGGSNYDSLNSDLGSVGRLVGQSVGRSVGTRERDLSIVTRGWSVGRSVGRSVGQSVHVKEIRPSAGKRRE